jgi:hypothetical protein
LGTIKPGTPSAPKTSAAHHVPVHGDQVAVCQPNWPEVYDAAVTIKGRSALFAVFLLDLVPGQSQRLALGGEAMGQESPAAQDTGVKPQGAAQAAPERTPPSPQRTVSLEDEVANRHLAFYLVMGPGTPVGAMGLEAVARWRVFELAAGLGLGMVARSHSGLADALQWALMPRLRAGKGRHAVVLGVGISWGKYEEPFAPADGQRVVSVVWLNAELGGELWTDSHFAFRYFLGFATSLRASPHDHYGIPYTGIGFGYSL